ncbi:Uncharacterized protein TCAP_04503 [Tolypocladium capitatum]|uniref:Rhodopsin domain-containing protein n=1 Tax=Tolypocladium capitatum TaxID=45235 RepID=A0A2K3QDE1_9HYPO|nr:Uncharacterized protein TCAP_04503 [Tolypocladium capitatum]
MTIYSDPPSLRPFRDDKPTLLVCWWATSFCTLMILLRIAGRFIRTERLFLEDKIAALAIIPLVLRMVCVHFILIFGTNNADFDPVELSATQIHQKSVASGLVLASRFFYAATLWTLKCAILEFLRRLTGLTWQRSHQTALVAIRWTLVVTFIGVVIGGLAECQPFNHYWQVLPDPGGRCRQGYVQLITMATCNIFTDFLLLLFPIPIIVQSHMTLKRKLQLIMLFSLSLAVVAVTAYRLPRVFEEHSRQQYRSLLASVELVFATAAANALVLGSFVRDRGVKKQRFKRSSLAADSFDRSSNHRRSTLHRYWGSDEDLARDVGLTVDPELLGHPENPSAEHITSAPLIQRPPSNSDSVPGPRRLSFLDVGGLLDDSVGSSSGSYRRESHTSSSINQGSPHAPPTASFPSSTGGVRRGSTALLQDLGGLLGPLNTRSARAKPQNGTELQSIPQSPPAQSYNGRGDTGPELMDPGGLLK